MQRRELGLLAQRRSGDMVCVCRGPGLPAIYLYFYKSLRIKCPRIRPLFASIKKYEIKVNLFCLIE